MSPQSTNPLAIRPFHAPDAPSLLPLSAAQTARAFRQHIQRIRDVNGRCWTLTRNHDPIGYLAIMPLPGLPGLVELEGGILPWLRRRGYGSHLLQTVIDKLSDTAVGATAVTQLSAPVPALDTPAARFLQRHGFFLEHEELRLERPLTTPLPPPPSRPNCSVRAVSAETAVAHFPGLYDRSFAGTRWYQPFTPAEMAATFNSPDEMLFLFADQTPLGFAWLRRPDAATADIEPIGIVRDWQRQGYGRFLLHHTLTHLQQQGVRTVRLGVWRANQPARRLYRQFGFAETAVTSFLAYDLAHSEKPLTTR